MADNCFVISINGLAAGENTFLVRIGREFFVNNENYEVLDADLRVSIVADKSSRKVDLDLNIDGTITVPCDRCLSPVKVPVSAEAFFRLRTAGSDEPLEESQEEVFLTPGTDSLDLSQEVYDYALLALPLQRFHNEGECDAVALGYLSQSGQEDAAQGPMDTPFSSLAEMLNNKD